MTRIRTWVTSATTKGTNHYTITATATAAGWGQKLGQVIVQQVSSTLFFCLAAQQARSGSGDQLEEGGPVA